MRQAKDTSAAWGRPKVLVGVLLVGLAVSCVVAAQGVSLPPTVGTSKTVANAVPGERFTFTTVDGKSYSAVLVRTVLGKGDQMDFHEIADVKLLRPAGPGEQATLGTAPAPDTPGTPPAAGGANPSQGNGSIAGNGVGATVTGVAVAFAGFIAVPSSLRRQLSENQAALDAAIRDGQVQVVLHSQALSSSVAGAEQATQALRSLAANTTFSPAAIAAGTLGAAIPDFSAAPWALRASLESSWQVLSSSPIASAAHGQVRDMGLHSLSSAQQSLRDHDIEGATVAAKLAEAAAWVVRSGAIDILIGLNPLASMARDATELMTGKNLLTGEVLSEADMWMRGVSLGVGLVTGGGASTFRQALSRVAPIVDKANVTRKLLDTTMQVAQHVRVRWGRVDKYLKTMTSGTDGEIRDLVFRGIREGVPYWDVEKKNVAFFLKTNEKKWFQVAVDFENNKVVTVTSRSDNFWHKVIEVPGQPGVFQKRWVPIEIPVKSTPPSLTLGLPGKP